MHDGAPSTELQHGLAASNAPGLVQTQPVSAPAAPAGPAGQHWDVAAAAVSAAAVALAAADLGRGAPAPTMPLRREGQGGECGCQGGECGSYIMCCHCRCKATSLQVSPMLAAYCTVLTIYCIRIIARTRYRAACLHQFITDIPSLLLLQVLLSPTQSTHHLVFH